MKILIVDDEELARRRLRQALEPLKDIELVEACDGFDALEAISTFKPDLVLLDIEMPELTGFDVLRNVGPRTFEVIFQTAYDNFAIKAFEVNACDYLLKPYSDERLFAAIDKATARLSLKSSVPSEDSPFDQYLVDNHRYLRKFAVTVGNRTKIIEEEDVVYFLSEDHVTRIFLDNIDYAYSNSLTYLEKQLDPKVFVRLHRNNIVAIDAIETVKRGSNTTVLLRGGIELPVRRERKKELKTFLSSLT